MEGGRSRPDYDGGASLDGSETSSGSLIASQNQFPVEHFLDAGVFERGGLEIPRPEVAVPPQVQACLGDIDRMRRIARQYFDTVHTWMPIVCRQRFSMSLINQLACPRADVVLLVLCMKISIWAPQPDQCHARSSVAYVSAKKFLLDLEISGMLTLETLQAGVLICLFELGHAIYPSAYLTVGTLARYGSALGLDKDALKPFSSAAGWTRAEEVKRVWWAVLILDRFVCMATPGNGYVLLMGHGSYLALGSPDRSLATHSIRLSDSLPVDDEAWDRASPVPPPVLPLSCSTLNTGRFSRIAQATYLLDLVLRYRSNNDTDARTRGAEAAQLRRTLLSLIVLADVEGSLRQLEFCPTNAVCYRYDESTSG
ncbi:fungal specific transcription factor domain containing protein [Grosmannia clavigera kw1407]|uniref:Fungal specific transcription factor domain containing protein n=1 Tax=Grosmannia clavigera (strain kw1407 / UAMH 11150) TaxID=655863 RepID=F0XBD6_GROCL|nr:fungal specific transcription factor domain containing protein [Grosmannia clavigera kw1407]EFX05109.1 fungal specific transcription factor domain containing protein [Grosmannia clavigera kw1407]